MGGCRRRARGETVRWSMQRGRPRPRGEESQMSKVRGNRKRRVVLLRLAVVIGLTMAAHVLHAGSASAATPAGSHGAADASGGSPITLAGFTSQHFPVVFKVS